MSFTLDIIFLYSEERDIQLLCVLDVRGVKDNILLIQGLNTRLEFDFSCLQFPKLSCGSMHIVELVLQPIHTQFLS